MQHFYKIRNDGMFKGIFCNEKNRDLLKELIECVIHEEVEIVSLKVPELLKDNMHIKNKTLDVLVKTKNGEINIEINSLSDRFLRRRNAGYIFKRYSDSVEVGESYQDMPRFIQINLTANLSKDYPLTSKYLLYDKDNNLTFIDNLIIYEINLKKYTQMCYNKKEKNILCMLDMNYEELVSVKGDMYMNKLKDEAIKLNNDEEFVKYLLYEYSEDTFYFFFKF